MAGRVPALRASSISARWEVGPRQLEALPFGSPRGTRPPLGPAALGACPPAPEVPGGVPFRYELRPDPGDRTAEPPPVPWGVLAAVKETSCPGEPGLRLASRARPPWDDPYRRHPTPAGQREILRRDGYRCSCPGL